ncbi:UDP-glucose dehydrogenase family protein [Tateyamaria pelophila]|uniref:UDP-glucose dehydrogenase family protein n=1 Tax=Tateyamaria pelophila TaxID=328415 RepID=UPI001CBBB318|nr:UDP-glucose/GDP-mannose dehydrogenase family protein [Tateyamaria pelophila]
MKIAVIGTGYVGLVSGTCLAELGHHVICIDQNKTKISGLQNGEVPIYEPGLAELLLSNINAQRLEFSTNLKEAVQDAEAVFIAVGTPSGEDGQADLSYVSGVANELGNALNDFTVVVTKSTVPVGTNRTVEKIIRKTNPLLDFEMVSNPEFLKEGAAIKDFMQPDRVVYGVTSDRAAHVMERIYQPLVERGYVVQRTNLETAELIKYASNAFLATKITFINQMAALCERVGADVQQLAIGMGSDSRIGDKFLSAGPGYGGSCFPKDTIAIARTGQQYAEPQSIVEAVISANDSVKNRMVDKVLELCDGRVSGKRIAVLGATFKADTDDMRDAPSLTILPRLIELGAEVCVYDPQGRKYGEALMPKVEWQTTPYEAAKGTDALIILTEWREFRDLDLQRLAGVMAHPLMADLRNLFTEDEVLSAGFLAFTGIGVSKALANEPIIKNLQRSA